MPEYIPLSERYDSFVDSGTPPFRHASQAPVHEADPSCVTKDPGPSPPQTLPPPCPSVSGSVVPQHHAVGPHTPVSQYVSPYQDLALTPSKDPTSAHISAGLQSSLQNREPVDFCHHQDALAPNQQPPFSPDSQVQSTQENPVGYTGLLSPPSSLGPPSPPSSSGRPPPRQTNPFGCRGCVKTYRHKSALTRHILESKKCPYGRGGRRFTCFKCARQVAARRSTLKQHLMEVHAMKKKDAEDLLNVWYNRYGAENDHSEVAAMLGFE